MFIGFTSNIVREQSLELHSRNFPLDTCLSSEEEQRQWNLGPWFMLLKRVASFSDWQNQKVFNAFFASEVKAV